MVRREVGWLCCRFAVYKVCYRYICENANLKDMVNLFESSSVAGRSLLIQCYIGGNKGLHLMMVLGI